MAMVVAGSHRPPPPPQSLRLVPPPPPQPPPPPLTYRHHCKVCKKGFMCGRALGGHMRAHGIGDDNDTMDDDDGRDDDHSLSPCDGGGEPSEAAGSPTTTTTKRMYALRTNPGRPRNCRTCENCGKEFTSWKTLLDHGRCGLDEEDGRLDVSLRSPPLHDGGDENDGEDEEEGDDLTLAAGGWSKGKRSRRAKVMAVGTGSVSELQLPAPSTEEEDLANFLVMLSSSSSSSLRVAQPAIVVDDADQESCASGSKDEERNRFLVPQPISMAAPMMAQMTVIAPQVVPQHISTVPRGMFECKACKKVFTSHQALGGHRASHKKVKGCFAAKLESSRNETSQTQTQQQHVSAAPHDNTRATTSHVITSDISMDANTIGASADADGKAAASGVGAGEIVLAGASSTDMAMMMSVEDFAPTPLAPSAVSPFKKKGKVHECSICHRVFTSGQALGGHKRCHWLTSGATDPLTKLQPVAQDHAMMAAMCHQLTLGRPIFDPTDQRILDLNVPTNPLAEAVAARQQQHQQVAALNDGALCLNAAASVYLQSWTGHSNGSHVNKTTATSSRINDAAGGVTTEDDEADSTSAKRAKIGDLKDMKVAGESLPWLQVGIGISSESKEKNTQE
uniref:C2H2-type domain-containing protein n=1 Tax=Oryza barthii TaxID=65489 RepID=A0A0D3F8G6_9ORYZ